MSQLESATANDALRRDGPPWMTSPCHIEAIEGVVDRAEVLRYLGYPADAQPNAGTQEVLNEAIAAAARLARPRGVFAVFPVLSATKRRLRLSAAHGETEFQGAIGEFLGPVNYVAAFIATAGPAIEHQARQFQGEGDHLSAMIFDAVGSERAEAAEAEIRRRLHEHIAPAGFDLTLPYSPGYCGMALTEQTKLFQLLSGNTVGVSLTPACLMQPIKSISGLIGIGPATETRERGSPCDRCELWTCNMRR